MKIYSFLRSRSAYTNSFWTDIKDNIKCLLLMFVTFGVKTSLVFITYNHTNESTLKDAFLLAGNINLAINNNKYLSIYN